MDVNPSLLVTNTLFDSQMWLLRACLRWSIAVLAIALCLPLLLPPTLPARPLPWTWGRSLPLLAGRRTQPRAVDQQHAHSPLWLLMMVVTFVMVVYGCNARLIPPSWTHNSNKSIDLGILHPVKAHDSLFHATDLGCRVKWLHCTQGQKFGFGGFFFFS